LEKRNYSLKYKQEVFLSCVISSRNWALWGKNRKIKISGKKTFPHWELKILQASTLWASNSDGSELNKCNF